MSGCEYQPGYSLYISRFPVNNQGASYVPSDYEYANYLTPNGLMYLCSDASISYEIDYPMVSYVPPTGKPSDAILIDEMAGSIGRISIAGERIGGSDVGSNRWFDEEIEEMISDWQIVKNAYLLRMYNMIGTNVDGLEAIHENKGVSHMDLYVYIKEYTGGIGNRPNILQTSMKLIQRNMLKGLKPSNVNTIYSYGTVTPSG